MKPSASTPAPAPASPSRPSRSSQPARPAHETDAPAPPLPERRPVVTVDVAILTIIDDTLQVLLVKRPETPGEPFAGLWALPGGFIDVDHDPDLAACAQRKLHEKTGLVAPYLEQVGTWGSDARDPRGWSVTTVYAALMPAERLRAGGNAPDARWHPLPDGRNVPAVRLAFDHRALLEAAVGHLRDKTEYSSVAVYLLPDEFTLPEMQRVFEVVLGKSLDKKAFRTRMTATPWLEEVDGQRQTIRRPAQLYRVRRRGAVQYFNRVIGARE